MAIAAKQHRPDRSQLYIAVRDDCQYVTARDIADSNDHSHKMYCPCCLEKSQFERVHFDPVAEKFIHSADTRKACYRDDRCNDRHHLETSQVVLAKFKNDLLMREAELEYWTDHATFDVYAETPDRDVEGVIVEVHHRCANVKNRMRRKVSYAARLGLGVHIVHTSEATHKQFLQDLVQDHIEEEDATVGSYVDGELDLGAMIHPSDVL